jgi:hypothetical protein
MQASKKRLGAALVTAAAVAVPVVGGGSSAVAGPYDVGTGPITIQMRNVGKKKVFFKGPKTISRGAKLTVENASNPQKIGPHTFTLVKAGLRPKTLKDQKACGKLELPVCARAAKAHKFEPPETINKPDVEAGRKGWDKSFGKKGDTWFTPQKGATETRKVTAPVGTTLTYFCLVHPNMHGTLKVIK